MIPLEEAERIILDKIPISTMEKQPLSNCVGRVLREPVLAQRDAPPYDRAMMDGFAFRVVDAEAQSGTLSVCGKIAAGEPGRTLGAVAAACEIMTGAILPADADTVVPYEEIEMSKNGILIPKSAFIKGRFIDRQASNHEAGSVVLSKGLKLHAAELAVAATEGHESLWVNASLTLHLITTGDEVVSISEEPKAWQIRGSHAAALSALVKSPDVTFSSEHVSDHFDALKDSIENALKSQAWLLICGGVSKGEKDYVIQALESLGAEIHFHRVAQRPGHPMAFAIFEKKAIFCLPGNPLSVLCTARRHLIPAIERYRGAKACSFPIPLSIPESLAASVDVTRFLPVKIESGRVSLLSFRNSGSLHALAGSSGFIEIPPSKDSYPSGTSFAYLPWSS